MTLREFKRTLVGGWILEVIVFFDRLINLVVNWNFEYTLSAWYGRYRPNCWLCRQMDKIEQDHCLRAAVSEGLISWSLFKQKLKRKL